MCKTAPNQVDSVQCVWVLDNKFFPVRKFVSTPGGMDAIVLIQPYSVDGDIIVGLNPLSVIQYTYELIAHVPSINYK